MISRLHIIGADTLSISQVEMAEMACRAGADWIQARIKNKSLKQTREIVAKMKLICDHFQARLIINDHPGIAKKIKAHGVHLGKEDMSVPEARKLLGKKFIIGATANTAEEVKKRMEEGADYIGLGPYKYTHTKENLSPLLGLQGIEDICIKYGKQIPIIAIGGIEITDIEDIQKAGAYGLAISSAISYAIDPIETCQAFMNKINQYTYA